MIFNKKAQGMPKWLNFIAAIIVLAGGALPLLSTFGVIGEIPAIPMIAIAIITIIAGVLLLLDGFLGTGFGDGIMPRTLNLITAIIILIGGVVPLLAQFKIIGELPEIPIIVFQGLLIVAGVILLLDAILGANSQSY